MKRVSRRLWLVRHGETDWSAGGRFNGWTDVPLNVQGRQQASSLAGELNERRFVTVWSSDLCRSSETARLAETEPVLDRRLRELDFGTLEGRTWAELSPRTRDALIDFDAFTAPGGESVETMRVRVLELVHATRLATRRSVLVMVVGPSLAPGLARQRIEVAIVGLLVIDILGAYGQPSAGCGRLRSDSLRRLGQIQDRVIGTAPALPVPATEAPSGGHTCSDRPMTIPASIRPALVGWRPGSAAG